MFNMYDKTNFFNSYFSRATEKQLIVESMGKRVNLLNNAKKILDLGCHNGALMQQLIDRYKDNIAAQVNIIGIDPSQVAINEYLTRDFAKQYAVQAYSCTAEEYMTKQKETVDWIIASQCLYWSSNLENIVNQIYHQSESALIVLRGKKGIYEIQSTFKDLLGNKQEKLYTSDHIEESLISQHIPFEMECHTTYIELPFHDDDAFNSMIAFFLQVYDIDISPLHLETVKKFILNKSENNRFKHDISLFWLGKARLNVPIQRIPQV